MRTPGTAASAGLAIMTSIVVLGCGADPTRSPQAPPDTGGQLDTGGPLGQGLSLFEETLYPFGNELVADLQPGVEPDDLVDEYGLTVIQVSDPTGANVVLFDTPPSGFDLSEFLAEIAVETAGDNARIDRCVPQTLLVGFFQGGGFSALGDEPAYQVLDLDSVHALSKGDGAVVAILDTGADVRHPDLITRTWVLPEDSGMSSEETKNGIDDDLDGQIDEAFGHGTHVAGVVAVVAPNALILPIKVLTDEGSGSIWDIVRAFAIAREYGVDIINLSFYITGQSSIVDEQMAAAQADGIAVIAAAGNQGRRNPVYPATSSLAAGIAASNSDDVLTMWSGAGSEIWLAAPGEDVPSTYPPDEYRVGSGTSMATPMVSGAVALVMSGLGLEAGPALARLRETAVHVSPQIGVDNGRVSPLSALTEMPDR